MPFFAQYRKKSYPVISETIEIYFNILWRIKGVWGMLSSILYRLRYIVIDIISYLKKKSKKKAGGFLPLFSFRLEN